MDVEGGRDQKRGVKRQADESNLSDDQRFAKRFNLLNLNSTNGHSNSYLPVQTSTYDQASAPSAIDGEGMQVDDTRDRVYIGDLDAEIAELEAYEPQPRLIFLPDIEKHFSRLPHQVLADRGPDVSADQQLVLYEVPKSITDDKGNESVRKAIIEARRRAQEQALERARHNQDAKLDTDLDQPDAGRDDNDAMDIE